MKLTAWRAALRIARRDAVRAKGRSALVMAMIALPVLGVAGADIVYRSADLDPGERITRQLGAADAQVSVEQLGEPIAQAPDPDTGMISGESGQQLTAEQQRAAHTDPTVLLRRIAPPGSTLFTLVSGPSVVTSSAAGLIRTGTTELDLTSPVWRGMANVVAGRAPTRPQEIAATRKFLEESSLHLGETTTVQGVATPFTITAAVEYPGTLGASELIARPGALIGTVARKPGTDALLEVGRRWLIQVPGGAGFSWERVKEANAYGFRVTSRQVLLDPPPRSQVPYYAKSGDPGQRYLNPVTLTIAATVAGMALLEIVLLAGPAFAVGARRSRRQLGLLAAGGGDRSHIRAVVLGGGVVLGLAGAVVGMVLAVVVVAVARPWLEAAAGQRFGHFDLRPLDLLGVAAIGLVTGVLAAVVPAVQASRQDVVAALTGRGRLKPPSKRLAVVGLAALAGGSALALLGAAAGQGTAAVLGGSALAELGMVACTPFVIGLFGKLGRWLPLTPRLALRDSVRHRGRTAPAVAAVMAAVAGSVAVGVYSASQDAEMRADYLATAPIGVVTLVGVPARADSGAVLDQARTAVENAISGLGQRGDVYGTSYRGNCTAGGERCGNATLVLPPERECPTVRDQSLSDAERARLNREDPRCGSRASRAYASRFGTLPAGDAAVLRILYGVHDPAAEQALADGKAVVFDPRLVVDGYATLELTQYAPDQPEQNGKHAEPRSTRLRIPAVVRTPSVYTAPVLLPLEAARKAGLTVTPQGSVWAPPTAPSSAAEQRANAALSTVVGQGWVSVERGYHSNRTPVTLGLTLFAAVVALGAAGIATGLAAADSQNDLATLAAVGATPRIRRALSGLQCGTIAAMGAVLGTVCGVVPAVALRKVEQAASSFAGSGATMFTLSGGSGAGVVVFPWWQLAATVLVLPVLAVLMAALLSRSRIALVRRAD
ncbi:FtsX-like permease family protein [Streptomyces sp. NPDC092296]|uniref:FtsX-like permease family protein n=1 Tax=Streptomyces sp. NPDC092296 TaxID=3366012 RepID=UPI003800D4CE